MAMGFKALFLLSTKFIVSITFIALANVLCIKFMLIIDAME